MHLQPLCTTAHVSVHFDTDNDWLYVDWLGELTLPGVQQTCLVLAECFLRRPYPRVLNNNAQVSNVSLEVAAWLAIHFMPHLRLAGIEQMAWICSPSLRGRHMVQIILNWLPGLKVDIFDDLAEGIEWLQQARPALAGSAPAARSAATQAQLVLEVQQLRHKISVSAAARRRPETGFASRQARP